MDFEQLNGSRMFHENRHIGNGGSLGHVILRTKSVDLGANQQPGSGSSIEVADFRNLQGVTNRPTAIIVHDAWMVVDYVNTMGSTITLSMGVNGAVTMFVGVKNVDPSGTVGQTFKVLRTGGTIDFAAGNVGIFGVEPNSTSTVPAQGVSFPDTPNKTRDISPGIIAISYASGVGGGGEPITGYCRGFLRVSFVDLFNGFVI